MRYPPVVVSPGQAAWAGRLMVNREADPPLNSVASVEPSAMVAEPPKVGVVAAAVRSKARSSDPAAISPMATIVTARTVVAVQELGRLWACFMVGSSRGEVGS
jgi:hypothetical protein